jgi:hypothetical protein
VPPSVISTYDETSRISKPTNRLNRSADKKAFDTPALSTRNVGWKTDSGASRPNSTMP